MKSAQKIFIQAIEQETKKHIILPFRKNSKNKTMNSDFLKEIFSSQIFVRYYEQFLSKINFKYHRLFGWTNPKRLKKKKLLPYV